MCLSQIVVILLRSIVASISKCVDELFIIKFFDLSDAYKQGRRLLPLFDLDLEP